MKSCKKLRYKPKKVDIEAARKMGEREYKQLTDACVKVLIENRTIADNIYIKMEFPYFCKFEKGFPKGVCIDKTPTSNLYRARAKRMLDWLYAKGYSDVNFVQLSLCRESFERRYNMLEKSWNNIGKEITENE